MHPRFSRGVGALIAIVLLIAGMPATRHPATADTSAQSRPVPVTSHPRLWLTTDDLPRLRSWATDDNPLWGEGLAVLAETLKADMDAGTVPGKDHGDDAWDEFPTESYAEFFAFLS